MAESRVFCFGFGLWNVGFVRACLAAQQLRVAFCALPWHVRLLGFDRPAKIVVWVTSDRRRPERRARKLVDQLVAGTLIGCPLYLECTTGLRSTPDAVVARLRRGPATRSELARVLRWWRRARELIFGIREARRGS